MLYLNRTSQFERDVKACKRRHWELDALKAAITALARCDEEPLPPSYRDHALSGNLAGCRSIHVPTKRNPPKDTWVIMYEVSGDDLYLYRTGTHDEVYGK